MEGGGWVGTLEDVTRQLEAENAREQDRRFLHQILDNIPMTIFVKNVSDRRYVLVNREAEKYLGLQRDFILGKVAGEIQSEANAKTIALQDDQVLKSEGRLFLDDYFLDTPSKGKRFFTSVRFTISDADRKPQYMVSVLNDVTERKLADERIAHLAHHDSLTDLPNRVLFRKQLEQALPSASNDLRVAVLYLDLDNFKEVNDSLGHPTGDALLQAISERLRGCLRDTDAVARLGGDEFAIIQTAVAHSRDVTDLARKILETIQQPYVINGQRFTTNASIGISMAPHDATDPDQLLKNADLALYVAKSEGRNTYRFFVPEMDARMRVRRELEADLRESILNGDFDLHYQPLVRLDDETIIGFEALLRWRHRTRGMVWPEEFIPIAEETGLITPLGEWVLRTACAEAMKWPNHINVSVNVSPAQFSNRTLPLTIVSALSATGLSASRLVLEITEAVLIRDDEVALSMLNQVRELGVRVAMDDFGTGYSSLSYLQRFPFDKIKIDRAFIMDIGTDSGSTAIVQAVVDIARSRNIITIAEGVETTEQRDFLRKLGCTEMQGYLFSPPVPASELPKFFSGSEMKQAR
jgi:diguanylate cyclase (GGDEF)-like protein/PAS domain S-box-containing protein